MWANFNEIKHHKYRNLTYAQAKDLDEYRRFDYNTELFRNPSKDWLYYDYQKLKWTNYDIFSFITLKLSENFKIALKPYYREEEKEETSGSDKVSGRTGSNPGIQISKWTVKRWGAISEIVAEFEKIKALAGFQYEKQSWDDEPTKNYWLNPDGSKTFVGWGRYTKSINDSYRYSPYVKLAGNIDRFNWQVGLKYLKLKESDNEGYITSYDSSGNPYPQRESKLDYGGQSYDVWLPTAGLSYTITDSLEIYSSFGRTFQQPYAYMPIVNLYYNLYSKFQKMGITMQDLFKEYNPEKTDNLDIGLRFRTSRIELYPTIFFSKHKNLRTPITPGWKDPDNPSQLLKFQGNPVSYQTFVGKAKGYGFELGSNIIFSDYVTFFFNPTYTKLKYDGDIVSAGKLYKTDGKQVIDVPEWMFTSGVILNYKGFELTPTVRFIGKRYGDLAHDEKMPSYFVVDLKCAYNIKKIGPIQDVRFALEFYNLFDKKYIVSPDYYPGAPFSVYGSVAFSF